MIFLIEKNEQNTQNEESNINDSLIQFNFRLPANIASEIDKRAKKEMRSRTNYITKWFMENWNSMVEKENVQSPQDFEQLNCQKIES